MSKKHRDHAAAERRVGHRGDAARGIRRSDVSDLSDLTDFRQFGKVLDRFGNQVMSAAVTWPDTVIVIRPSRSSML